MPKKLSLREKRRRKETRIFEWYDGYLRNLKNAYLLNSNGRIDKAYSELQAFKTGVCFADPYNHTWNRKFDKRFLEWMEENKTIIPTLPVEILSKVAKEGFKNIHKNI